MLFSGAINQIGSSLDGSDLKLFLEDRSFEKNNLNTDFKSPNAIPFDTTFREYDNLTSSNASKNDSSWLEKGQEVIRGREDEMNVSARAIQAKWKTHLKKDSLEESTSDKLKPKT